MIKAVLFDLFETLVTQFDPFYYTRARVELHSVVGLPKERFGVLFGQTTEARHKGEFESKRQVIDQIAETFDLTIDEDLFVSYERALYRRKAETFDPINTHVAAMLTALRIRGVKTMVVTNCEHFEIPFYESSDLPNLVDGIVYSCREGVAKPEPEIYQIAVNRIGVAKQECIYVGDGGTRELQGADRFGLTSYQAYWFIKEFEQSYQEKAAQPYPRLMNPHEVVEIIEGSVKRA